MKKLLLLVSFLLFFCSCGTTKQIIRVEVLKPAEIDLGNVKKIAILDFQGNNGKNIASQLQAKLFSTQHFEIMERTELDKLLQELGLSQEGLLEESVIKKVSPKLKNIDALVLGQVNNYDFKEEIITVQVKKTRKVGTKTLYHKNGKPYEENIYQDFYLSTPQIIRNANVSVTYRIISISDGRILATKTASQNFSGKSTIDPDTQEGEYLPDREKALKDLEDKVLNSLVSQVAPYYVTQKKTWIEVNPFTEKASKLVKAELYEEAKNEMQDQIEKAKSDVKFDSKKLSILYYDFALILEIRGNLVKAQDYYKKAIKLESDEVYLKALKVIQNAINDTEKLKKQKGGK